MNKELSAILGFTWAGIVYMANHASVILAFLTGVCVFAIYFHKALKEWGYVQSKSKSKKHKIEQPDSEIL
jgi:hypothetical protein